jgi:hypothetical protein
VIPPETLSTMIDSQKIYTKADFDNIIFKKERLILERNAELFPDGKSKHALELYHAHDTVKSKNVIFKHL